MGNYFNEAFEANEETYDDWWGDGYYDGYWANESWDWDSWQDAQYGQADHPPSSSRRRSF